MNRRSFFSRLASAAAGVVLASSVEVMGFREKIITPKTTVRTITMLTQVAYGPLVSTEDREQKYSLPDETEAPNGYHIVDVPRFSFHGSRPIWIDFPQYGEGMGYWAIQRHALPEGISLEEYNKMKPSVGNVLWDEVDQVPTWNSIMPTFSRQSES